MLFLMSGLSTAQFHPGFLGKKNTIELGFAGVQVFKIHEAFTYRTLFQRNNSSLKIIPLISYTRVLKRDLSLQASYTYISERNVKFDWTPDNLKELAHEQNQFYGVMSRYGQSYRIRLLLHNMIKGYTAPLGGYMFLGFVHHNWVNSIDEFTWSRVENIQNSGIKKYEVSQFPTFKENNKRTTLELGGGFSFITGKRSLLNFSISVYPTSYFTGIFKKNSFYPSEISFEENKGPDEFTKSYGHFLLDCMKSQMNLSYGILF